MHRQVGLRLLIAFLFQQILFFLFFFFLENTSLLFSVGIE